MTLRRLILLVGAVLLVAGVIALLVPVSVSGGNGESIGCGNGIASDLSAAKAADERNTVNVPGAIPGAQQAQEVVNQFIPPTNYVAQCQSALSTRRAWSIPLAVVGALAIAGAFLVPERRGSVGGGAPRLTQ
jgi:hypothetical protein